MSNNLYLEAYKPKTGGGGGTDDYNDLINKPKINGVTLQGDKSQTDLLLNTMPSGEALPEGKFEKELFILTKDLPSYNQGTELPTEAKEGDKFILNTKKDNDIIVRGIYQFENNVWNLRANIGGGVGTNDYNLLINKPQWNGEDIVGNIYVKTFENKSIRGQLDIGGAPIGALLYDYKTSVELLYDNDWYNLYRKSDSNMKILFYMDFATNNQRNVILNRWYSAIENETTFKFKYIVYGATFIDEDGKAKIIKCKLKEDKSVEVTIKGFSIS